MNCYRCEGNGEQDCPHCHGSGNELQDVPCRSCHGNGAIFCGHCGGTGLLE